MPVFTQEIETEMVIDLDDIYEELDTEDHAHLLFSLYENENLTDTLRACSSEVIEEMAEYIGDSFNSTPQTLGAIIDGPALSTEIANLGPISERRLLNALNHKILYSDYIKHQSEVFVRRMITNLAESQHYNNALASLGAEGAYYIPTTPPAPPAETPQTEIPPSLLGLSLTAKQQFLRNILHTLDTEQVAEAIEDHLAAFLLNAIAFRRGAIGLRNVFVEGVGTRETRSYYHATTSILGTEPVEPSPEPVAPEEEEEDNLSILLDQLLAAPPENLAGLPDEQFVQLVRKLNPEVKSLLNSIPHPTDPAASTALSQLKHLFG